MKRIIPVIFAVTLFSLAAGASAEVKPMMAAISELAQGSLVIVRGSYEEENGPVDFSGLGICYDADNGDFLTFGSVPGSKAASLARLELILPGPEHEVVPAELLGIRSDLGIVFLRAGQKREWKAVKFAENSGLSVGDRVFSAALMPGSAMNQPYVGLGYISCELRMPGKVYFVTGGQLTAAGSPVFNDAGQAVGAVVRPLYLDYQMASGRNTGMVSLQGLQESASFTPVEEFSYALKNIPRNGTVIRPAWLGAMRYAPLQGPEEESLGLKTPAVMLEQILPGTPASQAGIEEGDIIVAINGSPLEDLGSPELNMRSLLQEMGRNETREMTLTLLRKGERIEKTLTLIDMPTMPDEAPRYLNQELGFAVREKVWVDDFIDASATAKIQGLLVLGVGSNTPASQADLKGGDVIAMLNGQPVKTVSVFRKILDEHLKNQPDKEVVLLVHRDAGEPKVVSIRPPMNLPSPDGAFGQ